MCPVIIGKQTSVPLTTTIMDFGEDDLESSHGSQQFRARPTTSGGGQRPSTAGRPISRRGSAMAPGGVRPFSRQGSAIGGMQLLKVSSSPFSGHLTILWVSLILNSAFSSRSNNILYSPSSFKVYSLFYFNIFMPSSIG